MTMGNESQRHHAIDAPNWTAGLTESQPGVVDGFDPTPREVPFKVETYRQPGQTRVPLGHIVNVGDFDRPADR